MARLPWTKFQDFYLRLGFLKVLVALLDPNRPSVSNEIPIRRIQALLFDSARNYPKLWSELERKYPWAPEKLKERPSSPLSGRVTVVRALLLLGNCDSQLYAVTHGTAYKVLDWARDIKLIGAGNQITEAGLLLRGLLPREEFAKFIAGDVLAWNPFLLSNQERCYFLFHLCQVDDLTLELLERISAAKLKEPIEISVAGEMTCRAFVDLLDRAKVNVSGPDLSKLRKARELASAMADELRLDDLVEKLGAPRRLPSPLKIPSTSSLADAGGLRKRKRTTKNTQHQAVPRLEQLVDLGFLKKPKSNLADTEGEWKARSRWRYALSDWSLDWVERRRVRKEQPGTWEWEHFARAALRSGFVGGPNKLQAGTVGPVQVAEYIWSAYQRVKRFIGQTPFSSVAVMAMLLALEDEIVVEMRDCHDLILRIKKRSLLSDCISFASADRIDRMFVHIRPGFVDGVKKIPESILVTSQTSDAAGAKQPEDAKYGDRADA